jgi:asparagine synthase (glutamine-hydrolysing)
VHGHPIFRGQAFEGKLDALCRLLADSYAARKEGVLEELAGDFALAIIDERDQSATIAIDRMGIRNLVYQEIGATLVFGATTDVVAAHPLARTTIDPQALYDYVYFHMVPGPGTIYREQSRLAGGAFLRYERGRAVPARYWTMHFAEDARGDVATFKPAFRSALRTGVEAFAVAERSATFLSGGTDSSTVSGLLGVVTSRPPRTYSIGFDAAGYDEMAYARIAARHFGADHHEYYVTPDDVLAAVPMIAAAQDQPFGNASAIPTYWCARKAADDGITRMLGGDGGDELFGGNERYAKQHQLALYDRVPGPVRAMLRALLFNLSGPAKFRLLRRGRSYIEQASLSMPARYVSYNLLEWLGPQNVFAADFLQEVDVGRPLAMMAEHYASTDARSLINRMLALDAKFTLADNDLPKVTRSCDLAGVDVAFPLLHEAVVDVSLALPPDFKLRGSTLRYFFKEALRDFLPRETIAKQKHGFGLPAGLWLRDVRQLRELAQDALAGLRKRGIFNATLLDELMTRRLDEHAGYYGTLVWVLMMLELWSQAHATTTVRDQPAP